MPLVQKDVSVFQESNSLEALQSVWHSQCDEGGEGDGVSIGICSRGEGRCHDVGGAVAEQHEEEVSDPASYR